MHTLLPPRTDTPAASTTAATPQAAVAAWLSAPTAQPPAPLKAIPLPPLPLLSQAHAETAATSTTATPPPALRVSVPPAPPLAPPPEPFKAIPPSPLPQARVAAPTTPSTPPPQAAAVPPVRTPLPPPLAPAPPSSAPRSMTPPTLKAVQCPAPDPQQIAAPAQTPIATAPKTATSAAMKAAQSPAAAKPPQAPTATSQPAAPAKAPAPVKATANTPKSTQPTQPTQPAPVLNPLNPPKPSKPPQTASIQRAAPSLAKKCAHLTGQALRHVAHSLLTLAILVGIVYGLRDYLPYEAAQAASATPKVARVAGATDKNVVSASATVVSNLDVTVRCKATGEVISLPHDLSDTVKQGTLLMEVDPTAAQRQLFQAELALADSEVKLKQARHELLQGEQQLVADRKRLNAEREAHQSRADLARAAAQQTNQFARSDSTAQSATERQVLAVQLECDQQSVALKLDELNIRLTALERLAEEVRRTEIEHQRRKQDLLDAKKQLRDTRVTAPIDGVISSRSVQLGQSITPQTGHVEAGTAAFVVSDLSRMFVLASVHESDMGAVQLNQSATIKADAFPDISFSGKVVRIAPRGTNASNVVVFEVKIEVTSDNKALLRPQMSCQVELSAAVKRE